MNSRKHIAMMANAADAISTRLYMRTMNMLPKPGIHFDSLVQFLMPEDHIAASRLVASFVEPPGRQELSLILRFGNDNHWTVRVEQPADYTKMFLSPVEYPIIMENPDPPDWLRPFIEWSTNSYNIYWDCIKVARLIDVLGQIVPMENVKLLWPDFPLACEAQPKDTYKTPTQLALVRSFEEARLPKRPMTLLWPGMGDDIDHARKVVGRALLAPVEPKTYTLKPGEVLPRIYRRMHDQNHIITVNSRAGVESSRHYSIT